MFWLVEANLAAARQGDLGHTSPTGLVERALEPDSSSVGCRPVYGSGDPAAKGRRPGEDDQDAEAEHHPKVELQ